MATYHSKNGKFCKDHEANVVTKDGKRFRVQRVLEPMDGDKSEGEVVRSVFVVMPHGMIPIRRLFGE